MPLPSVLLDLLLFVTGLAAGLVDSVAGGGGLITIPVLLGSGLPPHQALATNKLQGSFGSGSAMLTFLHHRKVSLAECRVGIIWTAVGAILGTTAVRQIDPGFLRLIIPFLLLAIAGYTLMTPRFGHEERPARLGAGPFYLLAGLSLGFYDGFFGPGTGSFWVVAFMALLGFGMVRATAHTKVMNFTSNIVSLGFFALGGTVCWRQGVAMGVGQFIGARIGARLVVSRGTRFVRPVFIAVVLAITVRLIWQNLR